MNSVTVIILLLSLVWFNYSIARPTELNTAMEGKRLPELDDQFDQQLPPFHGGKLIRRGVAPSQHAEYGSFEEELEAHKRDLDMFIRGFTDFVSSLANSIRDQLDLEIEFLQTPLLSKHKKHWFTTRTNLKRDLKIPEVLSREPSNTQELQLARNTLRETRVRVGNVWRTQNEKKRIYLQKLPAYKRELYRIRPRWPDYYAYLFYHLKKMKRVFLENGYEETVRKFGLQEPVSEEEFRQSMKKMMTLLPLLDQFLKSELADKPGPELIDVLYNLIAYMNKLVDMDGV